MWGQRRPTESQRRPTWGQRRPMRSRRDRRRPSWGQRRPTESRQSPAEGRRRPTRRRKPVGWRRRPSWAQRQPTRARGRPTRGQRRPTRSRGDRRRPSWGQRRPTESPVEGRRRPTRRRDRWPPPPAAILEAGPCQAWPTSAWGSPGERSLGGRGSQGSLGPGIPGRGGTELDSVSVLSGTLESLAGPFPDDGSSVGSDSEAAGPSYRRTDRYGFLGGSQYSQSPESSVPVDVGRQRELKWLEMFNHWDKWLSRRYQKVKLRCRKGIPSSLRARAWQLLSHSQALLDANPGLFQELERAPGEPRWLEAIEKDLHRQFPFHEMFVARGGHGQQDLYRVLKAYTVYRPQEGYCQAQAPVAAVLLMHMPAEQAFWCLVQICEKYLPGYYSAGLEAVQLDGEVFGALLRRAAPAAHRHLRRFRVEPVLYLTEWFMCIFARSLPWAAVLRVWDMFFCEGVKIMFRVGLVLLRQALGTPEKLRSCQGMYETMERLRSVPPPGLSEDALVQQVGT
ncbi:TBC1 domain family member 10B-like, partial [Chroicocephalus ridibundus]|uniref:TBC1 domain family member 10B-like n=1 Tax=Chroicocephalus ridibundus TaxID=1192867 RepID=UPI002FDE9BFA